MNLKAWIAEFVGTFGFVFIGVGSVIALSDAGPYGMLGVPIAHGLALAVMISATASVSGGHINPAVSIGAWLANKIKFGDMLGYIVGQLAGGVIALYALEKALPSGTAASGEHGMLQFGVGVESMQAFAIEAIGTFFLVFTVFGTCMDKRSAKMGGFYVGAVVLVMSIALGPFSGGGFNPARYFAPALYNNTWTTAFAHLVGPVLGGAVAALLYEYMFMKREEEAA